MTQNDATAVFRRTTFEGNHDIGVFVSTADAELDQVAVRWTKSRPSDDGAGFGLLVQNDAHATVRRSWIDQNQDANVYLFNANAALFEDTVLSSARLTPKGDGGFNARIIAGSSVTV